MTNIRIRYVTRDVDRYGTPRFYFRRPSQPKVRLPGAPGSDEFMSAYAAALAGDNPAAAARPGRTPEGSFGALALGYFASREFRDLDAATQKWRRRILEAIAREHGQKPVALMEARHVRKLRDAKAETSASEANKIVMALRAVFGWAIERDLVASNPARDVKPIPIRSGGHHTWTDDEIAAFEDAHPIGTAARTAFAILLFTGCRREDVIRIGRQHIRDGRLRYVQAKNEHRKPVAIDMPIPAALREVLDRAPTGTLTFITKANGAPVAYPSFGGLFARWCREAGLPKHCSAHGLRKAHATILANLGASPHEIMSTTGHRTLSEVGRYTREAAQAGLADAAVARLDRRRGKDRPRT